MSIEDHTVVGHLVVETLQYWPHTPVSLIPRLFHYEKGQPCTGSGEMARVVCTHPVNPSRNDVGRWSIVLLGSANRFTFWRIRVKVDICRFETGPRPTYVVW